jgi:hypothetical protein
MNVRTTDQERLDYLRWMLMCLEANQAVGHDIEDMIKDTRKAVRRREREANQ